MSTTIIFGMKHRRNWKENLAEQKDQTYQEMLRKFLLMKEGQEKEMLRQEIKDYWSKRRAELGFTAPPLKEEDDGEE